MRIVYATDILRWVGAARNIVALDAMRRIYGEPYRDGSGRSFWRIEDEDLFDLQAILRRCPLPQELQQP